MVTNANNGDQTLHDASPVLKLVIDKDGRWFQNGAEITHPAIYRQFNEMLEKKPDGGYRVRMGPEVCDVAVEDAPFVVTRLMEVQDGKLVLELNDGSREEFAPTSLWIGAENVPYVRVKDGVFHARFSRPAYYQLSKFIESDDSEGERFFLVLNGDRTPIKR
jgi:uncharacterized protein